MLHLFSPEYNQSFTLSINRNHRGFRRVVASKGIKLELLHKGWVTETLQEQMCRVQSHNQPQRWRKRCVSFGRLSPRLLGESQRVRKEGGDELPWSHANCTTPNCIFWFHCWFREQQKVHTVPVNASTNSLMSGSRLRHYWQESSVWHFHTFSLYMQIFLNWIFTSTADEFAFLLHFFLLLRSEICCFFSHLCGEVTLLPFMSEELEISCMFLLCGDSSGDVVAVCHLTVVSCGATSPSGRPSWSWTNWRHRVKSGRS